MGVPAFVNNGSVVTSASTTSASPGLPSSRVNGNLMIANVLVQSSGKTISQATSGWTSLTSITTGHATLAMYWRIVDTATDAAPAFSWTGAAKARAYVSQISGNHSSPIGTIVGPTNLAAQTTWSISGITSTADNSMMMHYILGSHTSSQPVGPLLFPPYLLPIDGYHLVFADGASAGGGGLGLTAAVHVSGTVSEAIEGYCTSQDLTKVSIEIKGTGAAASTQRLIATQSLKEVLYTYDKTTIGVRADQVVKEVLYTIDAATVPFRVNGVILEVLRTRSGSTPSAGGARSQTIII